jgi:hypothetical protein
LQSQDGLIDPLESEEDFIDPLQSEQEFIDLSESFGSDSSSDSDDIMLPISTPTKVQVGMSVMRGEGGERKKKDVQLETVQGQLEQCVLFPILHHITRTHTA